MVYMLTDATTSKAPLPRDKNQSRLELRKSWIHAKPAASAVRGSGPSGQSLGRGTPGFYGPSALGNEELFTAFAIGAEPLHYPTTTGDLSLRTAIASDLNERLSATFKPEQVIICNGGTQAIHLSLLALQCLCGEAPRCGFITPTWRTLPANQLSLMHGLSLEVPAKLLPEGGWIPNLDLLQELIQGSFINSVFLVEPSNPLGTHTSIAEPILRAIAQHQEIKLLLDLTYERFLYTGKSATSLSLLKHVYEQTFLIGSFSKLFAIPGLRLGFAVVPTYAVDICTEIIQTLTMGVSRPVQQFAERALQSWASSNGRWFEPVRHELAQRGELAGTSLAQAGFTFDPPTAGYYIFARLPDVLSGQAEFFARSLLEETGVAVVPGTDFGTDYSSFIRISFANPATQSQLREALEIIAEFTLNSQLLSRATA